MIGQGKISSQEAGYPSPNGRKWGLCDYNFTPQYLAYGNGMWLSTDSSGFYYSSKDGKKWIKIDNTSLLNIICRGMFFLQGYFFIYKEPTSLYFTVDGTVWNNINIEENDSTFLKKIYIIGTKAIILLGNGKLKKIEKWQQASNRTIVQIATDVNDLEYYSGRFVAATSTGGIIFNTANKLNKAWGSADVDFDSEYVNVMHKGNYWYATQITHDNENNVEKHTLIYSLNGVTWGKTQVPLYNGDLTYNSNEKKSFHIEYGNGIYTVVIPDISVTSILTSTDGINFAHKRGAGEYRSQQVKYINGIFIYSGNSNFGVKYSLNGKDLIDTNIPAYNLDTTDYIEDEHKGIIVGLFNNQLFYSLTDGVQKNFNTTKIVS